ncbi:MAG: ATP-binding protein, partial [Patescibacteria group bacterium]|nr:ATP-binding protein [Patescibacteria group bacterium]
MDKKSLLKKIILEFDPDEIELVERDYQVPFESSQTVSIIGPRRSGKTYFLYQIIKSLIKKGVNKRKIIYINFEDERLLPFEKSDFETIEEAYFELYPEEKKPLWFFLDEVQNISFWEKYVRRLQEKGYYVFVSGSSSKLLSYEIATSLRGRSMAFFIYPFSFTEFLKYKKVSFSKNFNYSRERFLIKKFYQEYFYYGGLPQVFELKDDLKIKYLQEYFNLVIYRDIVERYRIDNISFIKEFAKVLIKETSNLFSVTSYYKMIKNQGINIAKDTLFNYLSYLEENNLIFTSSIYSFSKKAQLVNPKKIYIFDQGLYSGLNYEKEKGKILETMVFLYFKRQGYDIFYYRDKYEIDIVLKRKNELMPVQVCHNLKDFKTFERETRALKKFFKEFKVNKGMIVTNEEEGEIKEKNTKI